MNRPANISEIKRREFFGGSTKSSFDSLQAELRKKMIEESKSVVNNFKITTKAKLLELNGRAEKECLHIDEDDEKDLFAFINEAKEIRLEMLRQVLSDDEKSSEIIRGAQDILHSRFELDQPKEDEYVSVEELLSNIEKENFEEDKMEEIQKVEIVEVFNEDKKEETKPVSHKKVSFKSRIKNTFTKYFNKVNNYMDSLIEGLVD